MKNTYIIIKDNIIQNKIVCDSSVINDILKLGETSKVKSECNGSVEVGSRYISEDDIFIPKFKHIEIKSTGNYLPTGIGDDTGSVFFSYNFSQNIQSFDTSSLPIMEEGNIESVVIEGSTILAEFVPSSILTSSISLNVGTGTITSVYDETLEASILPNKEFLLVPES